MRTIAPLILLALALAAPSHAAPPPTLNDRQRILHFLGRAGFGPRPGDVARVEKLGLFMYVQQQLHPETIPDGAAEARLRSFRSLRMRPTDLIAHYMDPGRVKSMQEKHMAVPADVAEPKDILADLVAQRLVRAVHSERQLQEVMVDFWLNHFNVLWSKGADRWLLTAYERDAIRPRAMGRFRDLLGAVAHSPAMLFYLDNWLSRKKGLNENYARELLELHTLGVDGGYTQRDVVEVARCFTGWTLRKEAEGWGYVFRRDLHDDEPKTVLGEIIPGGGGEKDGERVLDLLARHPSTARYLALQLCRALVADDPPPALVDRVARTCLRTDGDVRAMLGTVFNASEFWSAKAWRAKLKTPLHLAASAIRGVGGQVESGQAVQDALLRMGMPLYLCEPPTGYVDRADRWLTAGNLLSRLNFCVALATNHLAGIRVALQPAPLDRRIDDLLGGDASEATRQTLAKAASTEQAVSLILGSPDFQRR